MYLRTVVAFLGIAISASLCRAQEPSFSEVVGELKEKRDAVRSYDVSYTWVKYRDGEQFSASLKSGRMIKDEDANVTFSQYTDEKITDEMMRAGIPSKVRDNQDGLQKTSLRTPSGYIRMLGAGNPVLKPVEIETNTIAPLVFDFKALGLAVAGDIAARSGHDKVLANLTRWPNLVVQLDGELILCDFGTLRYWIDPQKDYWPVQHEFTMLAADGSLQLLSRCELELSRVHDKWLPSSVRYENGNETSVLELEWHAVNASVAAKYSSPRRFAQSLGKQLVQIDQAGFIRPVAP